MEGFDPAGAGRRLATFTDDLSNWYVRRSRRRFWEGPGTPEGAAAFATLHECLHTLTRLLAPFTPFLTDYLWGVLGGPGAPESVHLASWPAADETLIDERLSADMALVRRLVELGRSARASATVRTRQPLARGLVSAPGYGSLPAELVDLVADELNVHEMGVLSDEGGDLVDYTVKPNFRALGKRFGKGTQPVAAAITAADPAWLAAQVSEAGAATLTVDGAPVELGPDDVIVTQTPRSGWAVGTGGGETVALEVTITPELRREGMAREVVRLIQDERKNAGLDVSDRILLWWDTADDEVAAALAEHGQLIAGEVLAQAHTRGLPDGNVVSHVDTELGLTFWLRRA
jgi:isoleucyl-tRNA synthetase